MRATLSIGSSDPADDPREELASTSNPIVDSHSNLEKPFGRSTEEIDDPLLDIHGKTSQRILSKVTLYHKLYKVK